MTQHYTASFGFDIFSTFKIAGVSIRALFHFKYLKTEIMLLHAFFAASVWAEQVEVVGIEDIDIDSIDDDRYPGLTSKLLPR